MTTSPQITARIKKDETGDSLWLLLDRDEGMGEAYPLLEDELSIIRDAIDSYLQKKEV